MTYTAGAAGSGLKGKAKMSIWTDSSTTEAYAIALEDEHSESINTQVSATSCLPTLEGVFIGNKE